MHTIPARVYRVPETSGGLLRLVQESFALSDLSLHRFAERTGIAVATLDRRLRADRHREYERIEALLVALGAGAACRDRDGAWHAIVAARGVRPPPRGFVLEVASPAYRSLGEALNDLARHAGLSVRALSRAAQLPFASVWRLLHEAGGGALTQLLCALAASGSELWLLTADGAMAVVAHADAAASEGRRRAEAHRAAQQRYRARHVLRLPARARRRGCLRLDSAIILDLYQRTGLRCAAIAARAGVSPERIRQVLVEAGRAPLRAQRVRARQALAGSFTSH